jgi:hypothetical protein
MPIVGVSRIAVVMQSYRNRRTKPESKCCGRTLHIQGGGNLLCKRWVSLRQPVPTKVQKGVHFRGARRVQAPHRNMSDGFSIYALHTKRKSTPKNAAERKVPHSYSILGFAQWSSTFSLAGFAAFLVDFELSRRSGDGSHTQRNPPITQRTTGRARSPNTEHRG